MLWIPPLKIMEMVGLKRPATGTPVADRSARRLRPGAVAHEHLVIRSRFFPGAEKESGSLPPAASPRQRVALRAHNVLNWLGVALSWRASPGLAPAVLHAWSPGNIGGDGHRGECQDMADLIAPWSDSLVPVCIEVATFRCGQRCWARTRDRLGPDDVGAEREARECVHVDALAVTLGLKHGVDDRSRSGYLFFSQPEDPVGASTFPRWACWAAANSALPQTQSSDA